MIRQLPEGYIVKYHHRRSTKIIHAKKMDGPMEVFDPKGGETIAIVYDTEGKEVIAACAICSPNETFNKRLGRTIALGRALHALDNHIEM